MKDSHVLQVVEVAAWAFASVGAAGLYITTTFSMVEGVWPKSVYLVLALLMLAAAVLFAAAARQLRRQFGRRCRLPYRSTIRRRRNGLFTAAALCGSIGLAVCGVVASATQW